MHLSPHPRQITRLLAAALTLGLGLTACGGGDEAATQTTVTIPSAAVATSTAPIAPQEAPAPPDADAPAAPGTTSAPSTATAPGMAAAPGTTAAPDATAAPATGGAPARAATAQPPAPRPIIHLTRPTALRSSPGGPIVARLATRTSFDSPTVLPVLRRSGSWLAVLSSELPNRRVGWISARAAFSPHRTRYRIDVSLRRREVVVRRDGRVVSRYPVAIGGPSTPTPRGRFAVTDKLLTGTASSPYGCCILALSGHQTRTPQGWGGGDRIAIHATNLPETIGTDASLGCLRAPTEAIRRTVQTVPLGTIVTIRA